MKFDIIGLGEILIDFIPDGTDDTGNIRFIRKAGGAPLNLLSVVSRFGKKCAFIGKVGDDMFGRFLRETLKENNVCGDFLKTDDIHNTTLAFVALDENGDREFSFYRRFGADTFLNEDDIPSDDIASSRIFHFGSLSFTSPESAKASQKAINTASENGCIISYDPNLRVSLWNSIEDAKTVIENNLTCAHIAKLAFEEAELVTGKSDIQYNLITIAEKFNFKILLLTGGDKGVYLYKDGKTDYVSSIKVKAVDTTGAGDIFFGTFLGQFLKSGKELDDFSFEDTKSAVINACKIAGISTLKKGAISSIPDEIYDL